MSRKSTCKQCGKELGAKAAYLVVHALDTERYPVGVFCVYGCFFSAYEARTKDRQEASPDLRSDQQ